MEDLLGRPLRDLRISLTDRCNFRCRYCMPVEVFGPGYQFLPREEILTFGEIVRVTQAAVSLGVRKVRLTGGEPLLRRGASDLVALLAAIEGVDDLAMTSNGVLLSHHAERLRLAGLDRVTVSLDALDPDVFAKMNGVGAKVDRVLSGISNAQMFGLPVKVNMVVQRGVNEGEILTMLRWARENEITLRFIEYMDVGETNDWKMDEVVTAAEIISIIEDEFSLEKIEPSYPGEVAKRWRFSDGEGEFGVISSVTQPFCGECSRLRISAEGKTYTCLFASEGRDLRSVLRGAASDTELSAFLTQGWLARADHYSEKRGEGTRAKAEMSYLGG
ncbi:GTP 3',8-cyclase MoaA [Akkermansiaceae bacterium]|nr:GTP 3',8-cyclase MoaA [Akkermansiaceae bacterium]MDB4722484.1 GTP 3',8-cyclase MoaA [Akkermansiaceae bacterium]MDB4800472.1 GTP 3',8-cyclase MoaA [bacterium]